MNRKLILTCALAGTLVLNGCASMSDTERRTATGAGIGAAAAGIVTGEWGWALGGAAAGAAAGYLYDQNKKAEERKQREAYEQGVKDGKKKK